MTSVLEQTYQLPNGRVVPNRLVKSALSEGLAKTDGSPTPDLVTLYRRWAEGGAGMLVTGNVMVDSRHREGAKNAVLDAGRNPDAYRSWARAAQAQGALALMQISHPGRQGTPAARELVAPSAVPMGRLWWLFPKPRALESDEVEEAIDAFVTTARLAERAGFDGVQIHGAHGYLVSQFLSPLSNQRTDEWGGSRENRRRFLLEIIRRIRATVHPSFIVTLKLNSADFQRGGFDPAESMDVIGSLEGTGLDALEISGGNYETPAMMGTARASTVEREAYFLDFAREVRSKTSLPLMLTGGFRSVAAMSKALEENVVDLIGLGRPLITEPDLPRQLMDGTKTAATRTSVRLPIRLLDDLVQLTWYQDQMARIAQDKAPDPDLSRWGSAARGFMNKLFTQPVMPPAQKSLPLRQPLGRTPSNPPMA